MILKYLFCFCRTHFFPSENKLPAHELFHHFLEFFEVIGRKASLTAVRQARQEEVVVKTVFYHGSDAEFRVRELLQNGGGKKVRQGVADVLDGYFWFRFGHDIDILCRTGRYFK